MNVVGIDKETSGTDSILKGERCQLMFQPGPHSTYSEPFTWLHAMNLAGDHVHPTLVFPDSRGKDTASRLDSPQVQLRSPAEGVSVELPVDQVLASVDWAPRKVFKGGCNEVEVLADTDHTGIRVESRDDGVAVAETGHPVGSLRDDVWNAVMQSSRSAAVDDSGRRGW